MDKFKKLIEEKKKLQFRLNEVNNELKKINHEKMLKYEVDNNLEIGCYIEVDSKSTPANSKSVMYAKYLGIKDPYVFGYHQIKIAYRLHGCHEHIFFHGKIEEIKRYDYLLF